MLCIFFLFASRSRHTRATREYYIFILYAIYIYFMKVNYKDYYYKYKALKYYLKNNSIEKQKQIKGGSEQFIEQMKKIRRENRDSIKNYLRNLKEEINLDEMISFFNELDLNSENPYPSSENLQKLSMKLKFNSLTKKDLNNLKLFLEELDKLINITKKNREINIKFNSFEIIKDYYEKDKDIENELFERYQIEDKELKNLLKNETDIIRNKIETKIKEFISDNIKINITDKDVSEKKELIIKEYFFIPNITNININIDIKNRQQEFIKTKLNTFIGDYKVQTNSESHVDQQKEVNDKTMEFLRDFLGDNYDNIITSDIENYIYDRIYNKFKKRKYNNL